MFAVGIVDMLGSFDDAKPERIKIIHDTLRPKLDEMLAGFDGLLQDLTAEFRTLLGSE